MALLIIDMSTGQLRDGWEGHKKWVSPSWKGFENISKLAAAIGDPQLIFDSRLWIEPNDTSTLRALFPRTGIAGTLDAELTAELRHVDCTFVKKLEFSAFTNSELHKLLQERGVSLLLIAGIQLEYCIRITAEDAVKLGYTTFIVTDACASRAGEKYHVEYLQGFKSSVKTCSTNEAIELVKQNRL